jgi:predicted GIY-YIG superfamily endonuclease
MFYFYILKCKDGTLYCGSAKNLEDRLAKHNSGKGSKYVISRGGGKIVYSENFRSWNKTLKREAEIKKWARAKKLQLIKNSVVDKKI